MPCASCKLAVSSGRYCDIGIGLPLFVSLLRLQPVSGTSIMSAKAAAISFFMKIPLFLIGTLTCLHGALYHLSSGRTSRNGLYISFYIFTVALHTVRIAWMEGPYAHAAHGVKQHKRARDYDIMPFCEQGYLPSLFVAYIE